MKNPPQQAAMSAVLSPRVCSLLGSHGITTPKQIKAAYPLGLLGIRGFGFKALREVEAAFLPGQHYIPAPDEWPDRCRCILCNR